MSVLNKLRAFVQNSRHIISISYKPTRSEFSKSAKIIILGILIVGVMGFVIALVISLVVTGGLSLL